MSKNQTAVPAHGKSPLAALVTWDGVRIFDDRIDVVALCHEYCKAVESYSCGQCIPCRVGSRVLSALLAKARAGKARKSDMALVRETAETMRLTSLCEIGRSSPRAVLHLLDGHPEAFAKGAAESSRLRPSYDYRHVKTAPCMQACPIHLDIPRYIEEIRFGNFSASLDTIRERLPLPGVLGRVCVRPCEANCRRGIIDAPLRIKHLKRFVADQGRSHPGQHPADVPEKAGIKVAIVGAGPAGLTCAHFLAKLGYNPTIFEMLPEPGGMAAVGIPDYRLPRGVLREEVDAIARQGVQIVYGKALGVHFTLDSLETEGFRAVFIAMGCHCHKAMGVEGEDKGYYGYIPGVYFLRNINLGLMDEIPKGRVIAVVGGGNVAIDCVRTALRVGFEEAHLVYRRTRNEMPADAVEVRDAEAEGVRFHFLTAPKKILAEADRVSGLECLRMELGEPDSSGRRSPVEVAGSAFTVRADVVVAAIGQEGDFACFCNLPGVEVTNRGAIIVNEDFMTKRQGVFSGGDCVTGPDVLIRACAHGRMSALKIDRFLTTGVLEPFAEQEDDRLLAQLGVFDPSERVTVPGGLMGCPVRHEPAEERRRDFREVDLGYTAEEAVAEAGRCLRCYRVLLYAHEKT